MSTIYSLAGTVITAGGVVVEGLGEGDVIEISHESEKWEHVKNADGSVISCRKLDESAMITVKLRYNSTINAHFKELDESEAYFELGIEWPNGDIFEAGECLVHKLPDIRDGEKTGNREWGLFVPSAIMTFGEGA